MWVGVGLALLLVLAAACAPANTRPVRGYVPGQEPVRAAEPPPTLASKEPPQRPLPDPSPGVAASPIASPSPSPNPEPPIVRTIQPAANAQVPEGTPVAVSAVLVGRGADLTTASLNLDGAEVSAQVDKANPRQWTIRVSQALAGGTHKARVLVLDTTGARGGFTWEFTVGEPTPTPAPSPSPGGAVDAPRPESPTSAAPTGQPKPAPKPTAAPTPRP